MKTSDGGKQNSADTFALRLKKLRRDKDVSQNELAQALGMHFTQVSRYERGLSHPTADGLKRIAEYFAVSNDFLLEGTANAAAQANLQDRELLSQFQEVEKLPGQDKELIKRILEAFLLKRKLQDLVAPLDAQLANLTGRGESSLARSLK